MKGWYLHKRPSLCALILSIVALLIGAITLLVIFLRDDDLSPIPSDEGQPALKILARDEWLAQPPENPLKDLELPNTRVIIAATDSLSCYNKSSCIFQTRFLQTFNVESESLDDIKYNFLVGGDGNAYEGRGWNKEAALVSGFNDRSIIIAFIGTFSKLEPPQNQQVAAKLLIDRGVELKILHPNFRLYGHHQLDPSGVATDKLYDIVTTWPHWSNSTKT